MCCVCNAPVELTTAKTDERGKAIHEDCYVLKMRPEHATVPLKA